MFERAADWPVVAAAEFARIFRFGIAGIANTAVGGCAIVLLEWGCGLAPSAANLGGFAVGIALGFILNNAFVFGVRSQDIPTFVRYVMAFGLAFGLNQLVLAALTRTQSAVVGLFLAQAIALATYSLAHFVLCRLWVFSRSRERI
jgi:putative flippase GtrA